MYTPEHILSFKTHTHTNTPPYIKTQKHITSVITALPMIQTFLIHYMQVQNHIFTRNKYHNNNRTMKISAIMVKHYHSITTELHTLSNFIKHKNNTNCFVTFCLSKTKRLLYTPSFSHALTTITVFTPVIMKNLLIGFRLYRIQLQDF